MGRISGKDQGRREMNLKQIHRKGELKERKRILQIIRFCKVCDGSHGEWIKKDELESKIKEEK